MTTPTCKTCGTKFPGKDFCKSCGFDPNATPTVTQRVARAVGLRKTKVAPSRSTKKDRAAFKAELRSLRMPNGRPKLKHGRQVKTRG